MELTSEPNGAFLLAAIVLAFSLLSPTAVSADQFEIFAVIDFSLSVSPVTLSVVQGGSGTTTVIVTSQHNFNSPVSLSVSGLPSNVIAGFGTNPVTPPPNGTASSPLIISVGASVPVATYTLTVTGSNGTASHSAPLTLQVTSSGPPPDFTITVSPSSLTIGQGSSGTATVTITSIGGFASPVALTAAGIPSGLTMTFGTNPVTPPAGSSATSTVSMSVASSTATGSYAIIITGNSGTLTHATTLTVAVTATAAPDFSVAASPSTIAIVQGSVGTTTLTLNSLNGFGSTVGLTVSWVESSPTGITFTFPTLVAVPSGGAITVTFAANANPSATVGSFTLRVTGTSGNLRHHVNLLIQVASSTRDFTVSILPSSVLLVQGSSATAMLSVQSIGSFASSVTLTSSGAAGTMGLVFGTNPVTPTSGGVASSSVTITAGLNTLPGTYTITVIGTSGSLSHSASITVTVTSAALPDFLIRSSASSISIVQGMSESATITVISLNGFSSAVALSGSWITSAPIGVTFTINSPITPLPNATASSTLTVMASSGASVGDYSLRVLGVSGSLSHFVDIHVTITGPQCVIATATYNSESSPEVRFLRDFRDNQILSTRVGYGFMVAFNAWYYSFSPSLAQSISEHPEIKGAMKFLLYPLILILRIGATVIHNVSGNQEVGVIGSGLVISGLVGAIYLGPPLSLTLIASPRGRRIIRSLQKPTALFLLAAFSGTLLAEFLNGTGLLLMVTTSALVLATLLLSALITSLVLTRLFRCLRFLFL